MLKNQTNRNNLLLSKVLVAFCAAGAFSVSAQAEPSRCEGLFESGAVVLGPEAPIVDPITRFFGAGVVAKLQDRTGDQAIYSRVIAPAVVNYARLSAEYSDTAKEVSASPVQAMLGRIEIQIRNESLPQARRDDRIRPKAMTADEREMAVAVGHYGMIEGGRLPSPKSAAQKRRDALDAAISQAQRAYTDRVSGATLNPVRAVFLELQRRNMNSSEIPKSEVAALLDDPVDFAIVYAQLNGLTATSGAQGEQLSPFVPWMRPVQNPEKYRTLANLAILGRAANIGPLATHAADIAVLETLRRAFAPQLTEFLP
jgi:hypothetical protein